MLKVLKGARVLVDCETGELHMDCGDGVCKTLGGSAADVMHVVFNVNHDENEGYSVTWNSSFEELMNAFEKTPFDCYVIGKLFNCRTNGRIVRTDYYEGESFDFFLSDQLHYVRVRSDNTVEMLSLE